VSYQDFTIKKLGMWMWWWNITVGPFHAQGHAWTLKGAKRQMAEALSDG